LPDGLEAGLLLGFFAGLTLALFEWVVFLFSLTALLFFESGFCLLVFVFVSFGEGVDALLRLYLPLLLFTEVVYS